MNIYFEEHKPKEGLGRQSLRGGAFSVTARAVNALVQVGSLLFLARLLTPEDYGLVVMVTALTAFAPMLVDLGTRDAVVQRARITEGEASTLFWLTIGVGFGSAVIISGCGTLIADFYGEPRLNAIVVVSSLAFVGLALSAQHGALLRRAVMFRELAIIDMTANILSSAGAIVIAYFGFGYWALVARPVAMYFLTAAGTWWYCRWLPRKPVITPGVKQMVRFGVNLSGFSLTDFVARNGDRVAVGRVLGARTLGYYQNAMFLYENLLNVLVSALHEVAVSGLSRLQNDPAGLRRAWAKALSTVTFFAMPVFGVLAITSEDLIIILLGEKWAQTGLLLSVLALRGIAQSAERTLGWLHVAAGRTDRWLRWGVLAACFQLLGLFCGLPFGPYGVVWACVISMHILFIPALVYAGRPLGIRARQVIAVVGPQFTGALTAAAVGFGLRASLLAGVAPIQRMAILVLLYIAMYLIVVMGLFRVTVPVQVCLSMLREFLPRPSKATGDSGLPASRD